MQAGGSPFYSRPWARSRRDRGEQGTRPRLGAAVDMGRHHVGHQPTGADPDPESRRLAERRMQGVGAQARKQQGGLMG